MSAGPGITREAAVNGDKSRSPRLPRSLSRQEVIENALALLEEHGLEALSMRRLAHRLEVSPNALYTHVRSKADLIDAVVDEVYAGLELTVDPAADWTDQLAAISQALREQLLDHPAIVPLALQQPGLGPHGLRLGEAVYDVLRPAGFSDQAVVGTVYALLTYVLGFVAIEAPRAGTDQQSNDEFVRRLRAYFGSLPARRFPHHVDLAPLLARFSSDDQFHFGLNTFLAGLTAQQPDLAPSASSGPSPRGAPGQLQPTDNERTVMPDKSPQKHNTKKVGKSLKEKRAAKKAKSTSKSPLL